MHIDGSWGEEELSCDLPVGALGRDEAKDIDFSARKAARVERSKRFAAESLLDAFPESREFSDRLGEQWASAQRPRPLVGGEEILDGQVALGDAGECDSAAELRFGRVERQVEPVEQIEGVAEVACCLSGVAL